MLHFSQFLLLLWKLSTIYTVPLIMLLYISLMNAYSGDFTFQQLDQGKNIHKFVVLAIYLFYLLFWNRCNKTVITSLKKLEY